MAAGGGCPHDHRRDGRAAAVYDAPASLGADGPLAVGAALDRLAAARPAPVVAIALHGPFGEDGNGPGPARGGRTGLHRCPVWRPRRSAWTRPCSSGCAAGSACPSSIGARSGSAAGPPIRPGFAWSSRPSRPGALDPRLMVKPARLGSSVGMTLVHDPSELDRRASDRVPLRLAGPGRDLSPRRARPGGLGHRQRPGGARAVRPRRDRLGPRVLRLRREVHGRPVGDLDPGGGHGPPASHHPQDRARRLSGHRRRGLRPDRLPPGRRLRSTCRRSTRSPASPRSASSRRFPPRAGIRSVPSAAGSSELAVERHAARAGRRLSPDELLR